MIVMNLENKELIGSIELVIAGGFAIIWILSIIY